MLSIVPFGLLVWRWTLHLRKIGALLILSEFLSTGLALNPLIRALEGVSKCKKALLTDGKLRVLDAEGKPMQDIWAIGDCAMAKDRSPLPATAQVANQKALYVTKSSTSRCKGAHRQIKYLNSRIGEIWHI